MTDWYGYAILSLLLMGAQRFLYKVSAEKRCNSATTTFAFMATVSCLSSLLFVLLGESVSEAKFLFFIALINSASFVAATITHMEALKHVPTSVAYPIIRLNALIVVLFSIFFFKDRLSSYQGAGIALAMASIVMLTRELDAQKIPFSGSKRGLPYVWISLLCGAVASISSKFAAVRTNRMAFIAASYVMSTLFSLGFKGRFQADASPTNPKDALIIGFVMGLLNLAGYYAFLKALSVGPLSIIVSVMGMQFVIPVILSCLIYKEKLTASRIFGILLTIISVLLLRV